MVRANLMNLGAPRPPGTVRSAGIPLQVGGAGAGGGFGSGSLQGGTTYSVGPSQFGMPSGATGAYPTSIPGTEANASQSLGLQGSQGMTQGYTIGGSQQQSQSQTQIVPGMLDVYNQLLGLNQQNYGNVLNAYTQGQQNLSNQLPGITGGYGALGGQVANTLGMGQVLGQNGNWGVATPAAQAIDRSYAQARGGTTQQMTNAGLGNTTVIGNMQNQNARAAADSYGALGAQLADKYAGYQSNIGLAGLAQQMQGLGLEAQMAMARGGSLAGYGGFANKAGDLTGSYGQSMGSSWNQSENMGRNASQEIKVAGSEGARQGATPLGFNYGAPGGGGTSGGTTTFPGPTPGGNFSGTVGGPQGGGYQGVPSGYQVPPSGFSGGVPGNQGGGNINIYNPPGGYPLPPGATGGGAQGGGGGQTDYEYGGTGTDMDALYAEYSRANPGMNFYQWLQARGGAGGGSQMPPVQLAQAYQDYQQAGGTGSLQQFTDSYTQEWNLR